MAFNFNPLKTKVKSIEQWLQKELASIRTGRATTAILDSVLVESYGSRLPINQVATISSVDARTIRVVPWDQAQIKNIEKAVQNANLGLSVAVDEKGVRISFPELTTERRNSLTKLAGQKLEEARVTLRLERDRVWDEIQKEEKDGKMSEDDKFRYKNEMQKIVDDTNKELEAMAERKEKEIMS
ncbi:MAG: ribosome recycling factor [bacterium]|nr:ribosome recycling factor [bacterium]